jgi:hypothetical protein
MLEHRACPTLWSGSGSPVPSALSRSSPEAPVAFLLVLCAKSTDRPNLRGRRYCNSRNICSQGPATRQEGSARLQPLEASLLGGDLRSAASHTCTGPSRLHFEEPQWSRRSETLLPCRRKVKAPRLQPMPGKSTMFSCEPTPLPWRVLGRVARDPRRRALRTDGGFNVSPTLVVTAVLTRFFRGRAQGSRAAPADALPEPGRIMARREGNRVDHAGQLDGS